MLALDVVAHGIGGVQDLPVPRWLFYWGAAIALVVSFLLLGALWRSPVLARRSRGQPLVSTARLQPLAVLLQLVSVALFALVWAAALLGDTDPFSNVAPTWVYIAFWLGLPLLSVVLGDVWRVLSPWRAIADGAVWLLERTGRRAKPLSAYPTRLGRWPAAATLAGFTILELAYSEPSSPRALAFAIALYTYVALFGMVAFGREAWTRSGEGFSVGFSLLARLAPLYVDEGALRARWPFSGLATGERVPGSTAVVGVMLGSVMFDGYSRTTTWQDLLSELEAPYLIDRPGVAELLVTAASVGGLLAAFVLVSLAFRAACAVAGLLVRAPRDLAPDFLLSLVPIAFAYLVAHYFSLFAVQGQFLIPLLSDPFGQGRDLLGTAGFKPNLVPFSPTTIWYVQASALVTGHVIGLAVAHDRAVAIFAERRVALRSQLPMLALMLLYTVGGLWILSRP
ncbi:MAG: hypothetical protein U0R50_15855 [Gaiellales bacterium]